MTQHKIRRCAIYTRKSSEEGLEQDFNSLHAQREACESFIKSQRGEGWRLVETAYDDGGFSGGSMERPALKRLLAEIAARKVDLVLVYKVDRLTRSLTDFAKIVELIDAHGVSFVSVTQQFNTTTSMGRLTLNMLLSFAQFEREVTGERIRDKIAASKRKGMWMGGFVPLGYEARDRKLLVNPAEAKTVRAVFQLYLELGNVRLVKQEADRRGLVTKTRASTDGAPRGARPLSRGYIYRLLSNPLYLGQIAHKGSLHSGQHEAIIDEGTWHSVQAKLAESGQAARSRSSAAKPSLLAGLIYDGDGRRMTPSHAVKNGRRYRYYVTPGDVRGSGADGAGLRLPALEIESLVIRAVTGLLTNKSHLLDVLRLDESSPASVKAIFANAARLASELKAGAASGKVSSLRALVTRLEVAKDEVALAVSILGLQHLLGIAMPEPDHRKNAEGPDCFSLKIPISVRRSGRGSKLIVGAEACRDRKPDPALLKAIVRAHDWFGRLASGQVNSANDIAEAEGVTAYFVSRMMRLAFLAPDITDAILEGSQPPELTAEVFARCAHVPVDWNEQRQVFELRRI